MKSFTQYDFWKQLGLLQLVPILLSNMQWCRNTFMDRGAGSRGHEAADHYFMWSTKKPWPIFITSSQSIPLHMPTSCMSLLLMAVANCSWVHLPWWWRYLLMTENTYANSRINFAGKRMHQSISAPLVLAPCVLFSMHVALEGCVVCVQLSCRAHGVLDKCAACR